jgi:hypothetical protein
MKKLDPDDTILMLTFSAKKDRLFETRKYGCEWREQSHSAVYRHP